MPFSFEFMFPGELIALSLLCVFLVFHHSDPQNKHLLLHTITVHIQLDLTDLHANLQSDHEIVVCLIFLLQYKCDLGMIHK